jgi:hypothetical protein
MPAKSGSPEVSAELAEHVARTISYGDDVLRLIAAGMRTSRLRVNLRLRRRR